MTYKKTTEGNLLQVKKDTFDKGMAYQRGLGVAGKCLFNGLPILLTDSQLKDLEALLEYLPKSLVEVTWSLHGGKVVVKDYTRKLLDIYSNLETIKNGLRVMGEMGQLDFTHAGDQYVSPYENQMEKVNYRIKQNAQ